LLRRFFIEWEKHFGERAPSQTALFEIGRNCAREHFETHRYPPRFSSHRFGVQLRWPQVKEEHHA